MRRSSPCFVEADILVVDDNVANVELLIALLEDEGYARVDGLTDPRTSATGCAAGPRT